MFLFSRQQSLLSKHNQKGKLNRGCHKRTICCTLPQIRMPSKHTQLFFCRVKFHSNTNTDSALVWDSKRYEDYRYHYFKWPQLFLRCPVFWQNESIKNFNANDTNQASIFMSRMFKIIFVLKYIWREKLRHRRNWCEKKQRKQLLILSHRWVMYRHIQWTSRRLKLTDGRWSVSPPVANNYGLMLCL